MPLDLGQDCFIDLCGNVPFLEFVALLKCNEYLAYLLFEGSEVGFVLRQNKIIWEK